MLTEQAPNNDALTPPDHGHHHHHHDDDDELIASVSHLHLSSNHRLESDLMCVDPPNPIARYHLINHRVPIVQCSRQR